MKKIYFLFIVLSSFNALAQKAEQAELRVYYNYVHITDTNFRDKPRTENMLLVVGKNASVYTSFDQINKETEMKKMLEEQIKEQAGSNNMKINLTSAGFKPVTRIDHYYFVNESKFYVKERLMNNYLIEQPVSVFNWSFSNDTTSIGGILCQKATANFKGRNWTVWFAPDLPFNTGPWKFNGLPGLVLQAYDDKKEVQFLLTSIEKVVATPQEATSEISEKLTGISILGMGTKTDYLGTEIKLPDDAIKTTQKDFDRLKQAQKDDPMGFMKTQMAGSGMGGDFKMTTTSTLKTVTTTKGPVLNNPIELTAQ